MKRYKKIKIEEQEEKGLKRNLILIGVFILIGIGVLLGTSYAMYRVTTQGTKKVSIAAGSFKIDFEEGEYINLKDIGTMRDSEGKETDPYTFTITNEGTLKAYYRITLEDEKAIGNTTLLDTQYLKYELKKDNGKVIEGTVKDLINFVEGEPLEVGGKVTYELRLWLDEKTPNSEMGKTYQSKVAVYSSQLQRELAIDKLMREYLNSKSYEESSETERKNMYEFTHTAGVQQAGYTAEELKDYRYIGKDPNNYVTFNGEVAGWRIIGIFTVEDGNGIKEKRIKLIRKDFLQTSDGGKYISFDNKPSGIGSSESEPGSNDWTDARLMYLLNPNHEGETTGVTGSLYWNQESGLCPYGESNGTKACDFRTTGLSEEARDMIGDMKWYLGGSHTLNNVTVDMFYERERGKETCTTTGICKKTRPISWVGKVGLMYPSDYGYATGGGSTTNRENCLAKELYNWKDAKDCATNDWLYDSNNHQWIITPPAYQAVFLVNSAGFVSDVGTVHIHGVVRPVVYLKSSVALSKGTGTSSDPFVFSE